MEENNKINESTKESVSGKSKPKTAKKKTGKTTAKKSVKKTPEKKSDFKAMKEEIAQRKEEKAKAREEKKAEKERIKAEKRVELAKIKAQKKAEKQKIKAQKERELKKKKLEEKARKEELKLKRKERKDAIKHETKTARAKRLKEEKAEKIRLKKQKAENKKALKEEKLKNKQLNKENKAKRKYERQKNKKNGVGGWLTAVITLGVTVLALGTLLTLNYLLPDQTDNGLGVNYEKSYYEFGDSIENLDLNLSKLNVAEGEEEQQRLLVEVAIDSELATSDLANLPLDDENKFKLQKFINQVGDFAKSLNNKLIDGKSLTEEEKESLVGLQKITAELKGLIAELNGKLNGYDFTAMLNKNGDIITKGFGEMQNLSIDYPELIYDGAFSDSKINETLRLEGEEITKSQAEDIFVKIFDYLGEIEVTETEEVNGKYDVYFISGEADGESVFAEISKVGGKLILFSVDNGCEEAVVTTDSAKEKAQMFLDELGINNMTAVWQQVAGNTATYNFAYEENGVIVYNDLIKVKVCLTSGKIVGYEAVSYYANHRERNIESAEIPKDEAVARVSGKLSVYSVRLALIPVGTESEELSYEIVGDYDGYTYYVYIGAESGKELDIFKVIDTKDGALIY